MCIKIVNESERPIHASTRHVTTTPRIKEKKTPIVTAYVCVRMCVCMYVHVGVWRNVN